MTTERLEERLADLERLLVDRFPVVVEGLRPGVSNDELDGFEPEFGGPLPEEFRVLYRWHDGVDGRKGLPGLGVWAPLIHLWEACAFAQEMWQFGFGPWWIPIASDKDSAYAIDTTRGPDRPARTLFFRLDDGVVGETDSVAGMIDQVIGLIDTGAVSPPDGSYTQPFQHSNIDPSFTLFRHDRPGREHIPDVVEPFRFVPVRRGTAPLDGDADTGVLYERLCVVVARLAELARRTLGRDQRVVFLWRAEAYQPGTPPPGGPIALRSGTSTMLDWMFRAFTRNHVDPDLWADVWYEAERLVFSLLDRPRP